MRRGSVCGGAPLLLLLLVLGCLAPFGLGQDWQRGRASWYGTPKPFVDTYASSRGGGESAFGILEWGACGYTNADASLVFPKDQMASYADTNPDSPGSCGRCYEIRCHEGLVLGLNDQPVDYDLFYYFPKFGYAKDDQGRDFPGNPAEKEKHVYVKCWDPNASIYVRIADECPCYYTPKGQKPYIQPSCCKYNSTNPKSGQNEFDLSFGAYEKLAHPMYPEMMLDFRPVDCGSKKPLQFLPGSISRTTLYDDMVAPGWAFFPYMTPTHDFNITAAGRGRGGSNAACAVVSPGGGMTWACKRCKRPGYQPFANAQSVTFWLRDVVNKGKPPPVKVTIGSLEDSKYCNSEVYIPSTGASAGPDGSGYLQYTIPMSAFACTQQPLMDAIGFVNIGSANTEFCVDDFRINQGAAASTTSTTSGTTGGGATGTTSG